MACSLLRWVNSCMFSLGLSDKHQSQIAVVTGHDVQLISWDLPPRQPVNNTQSSILLVMARTPEPNMIDPRIRLMARPPHPPHPPHAESSAPHPPRSLSSALQKARKITAAGVIRKPKRKKNKLAAPLYKPSGRKARATEKGPAIGKGPPGRVAK